MKPGEKRRLETLRRQNRALDRAYRLKECLAIILEQATRDEASDLLDEWLAGAARSGLRPIVKLARTVRKRAAGILAYLDTRMTNGPVEGINNKLRVIARRAYDFHSHRALILDAVRVLRRHRTGTASTHCYLRRVSFLCTIRESVGPLPSHHRAGTRSSRTFVTTAVFIIRGIVSMLVARRPASVENGIHAVHRMPGRASLLDLQALLRRYGLSLDVVVHVEAVRGRLRDGGHSWVELAHWYGLVWTTT